MTSPWKHSSIKKKQKEPKPFREKTDSTYNSHIKGEKAMISTRDPALAIPRRKGVWQKDDTQFYIDW